LKVLKNILKTNSEDIAKLRFIIVNFE